MADSLLQERMIVGKFNDSKEECGRGIRTIMKKLLSKLKRLLTKLKRLMTGSRLAMVLTGVAVYTLLCFIYWMVEIGPGGKKSFLDILLWNNINIIFSRGYTDYVPTTWKGRALLMIFILFSMLFLSTMIGFISSRITEYRNSPVRRIRKVQLLSEHVVIIGWKNDIKTLITDIIRKSGNLTAEDIVLVNNVSDLKMQTLLMDKELKGINYIRGDFTEEQTLQNANIRKATTALVLGEAQEGLEPELVDSRIFVCTLMIKAMNPRCHVCALVKTERYRNYLEAQKCDEVIYTEEYSRYILSTATSYTGMANVLRAMFGTSNGIRSTAVTFFPPPPATRAWQTCCGPCSEPATGSASRSSRWRCRGGIRRSENSLSTIRRKGRWSSACLKTWEPRIPSSTRPLPKL